MPWSPVERLLEGQDAEDEVDARFICFIRPSSTPTPGAGEIDGGDGEALRHPGDPQVEAGEIDEYQEVGPRFREMPLEGAVGPPYVARL